MRSRGLFCLYEERMGREGNGRAKRGKKPSGEWFFSSPGWRRHWPSAAGRVPLSPPNKKAQSFWAFCLFLSLLCPQNPAKRFHTKFLTGFHFEFHSLNEDAFWHSANTAYSAVPLFVCLNPSVAACPLNFPRIVDTRRGGTYNAKWRKRREIIYIIELSLIHI